MKVIAETLGVARSNLAEQNKVGSSKSRRGRLPYPDANLVAAIQAVIAEMPTYGYRRVRAVLRRKAKAEGSQPPNHKRVYRVMKAHKLLLQSRSQGEERRHDGKVATDVSNIRWCSDGLELRADNAEKVRVAFALDCCDREAISYVATTSGIRAEDVQDLMVAAIEHRFGQVNRSPTLIEWLTDNGSCYVAKETRSFAREIGLEPRTTPVTSPQSNGMAEAFVRTLKRDYYRVTPCPDARSILDALPKWFHHYNTVHPHRALGYRSPREFISSRLTAETVSVL
jgi:putative transposase